MQNSTFETDLVLAGLEKLKMAMMTKHGHRFVNQWASEWKQAEQWRTFYEILGGGRVPGAS